MPTVNLRLAFVLDGNSFKFMPSLIKMGTHGAEQAQQYLKDIVAARFAFDSRFVHVVVVVDVNALVREAGSSGEAAAGGNATRSFYAALEKFPNIDIRERDVEMTRQVIESIVMSYSNNTSIGSVVLGLGKGSDASDLLLGIQKTCPEGFGVDVMRPWHFWNLFVDTLEPNSRPDPNDMNLIQEGLERLRIGKGLTTIVTATFDEPVAAVPGRPGHRVEYYSREAVENWRLTSLDPVITSCGLTPSRQDFEDVPRLCYNSYDRGCLSGDDCGYLHKYWTEDGYDEAFRWTMRHLPCRRIDQVCSESHDCMFGHHCPEAILGRCNRTLCRFLDRHHPAPRMCGTILGDGEVEPGRLRAPASFLNLPDGIWNGEVELDEEEEEEEEEEES